MNALASRIPNEILEDIFSFTSEPVLVSHVSQRFRSVALAYSNLWSSPPFRPNKLTELFLSRSNESRLYVIIGQCGWGSRSYRRDCQCAEYELASSTHISQCPCSQRLFLSSLLPHLRRWHTLDMHNLSPKLYNFLYNALRDMSDKLPTICRITISGNTAHLLDIINRDLTELSYFDSAHPWSKGNARSFINFTCRLNGFLHLQKLSLQIPSIELNSRSAIEFEFILPSLKSLSIHAQHRNQSLTTALRTLQAPHLTSIEIKVCDGRWESLRSDEVLWEYLSALRDLRNFSINVSSCGAAVGPKVVFMEVLAHCHFLTSISITIWRPVSFPVSFGISESSYDPEESWRLQCPLKVLHLWDCFNHREDLQFLARTLRQGENWDEFENLNLNSTEDYPVSGSEKDAIKDLLWELHNSLDGKIRWNF